MDVEGFVRGGGRSVNLSIRWVAQWRDVQRCRAKGVCLGGVVDGVDVDGSWDGEDRSVVETRDSGRQREKPKKPVGRELE